MTAGTVAICFKFLAHSSSTRINGCADVFPHHLMPSMELTNKPRSYITVILEKLVVTLRGDFSPEDGPSMFLQNGDICLQVHTAF